MTEEKKRGRGRPAGAPNKPKLKLITKKQDLLPSADAYEIFCQADIVAKKDPKLAVQGLQVFNQRNASIKPILMWVYRDDIQSKLPEGTTPYNDNGAPASDLTETALKFEHKKFQYFVTEQIPPARRETMWIELLEGMHHKEAELIDLVKDKKNPFPNITKEMASEAFPEIQV
jgi:hypothetical protein